MKNSKIKHIAKILIIGIIFFSSYSAYNLYGSANPHSQCSETIYPYDNQNTNLNENNIDFTVEQESLYLNNINETECENDFNGTEHNQNFTNDKHTLTQTAIDENLHNPSVRHNYRYLYNKSLSNHYYYRAKIKKYTIYLNDDLLTNIDLSSFKCDFQSLTNRGYISNPNKSCNDRFQHEDSQFYHEIKSFFTGNNPRIEFIYLTDQTNLGITTYNIQDKPSNKASDLVHYVEFTTNNNHTEYWSATTHSEITYKDQHILKDEYNTNNTSPWTSQQPNWENQELVKTSSVWKNTNYTQNECTALTIDPTSTQVGNSNVIIGITPTITEVQVSAAKKLYKQLAKILNIQIVQSSPTGIPGLFPEHGIPTPELPGESILNNSVILKYIMKDPDGVQVAQTFTENIIYPGGGNSGDVYTVIAIDQDGNEIEACQAPFNITTTTCCPPPPPPETICSNLRIVESPNDEYTYLLTNNGSYNGPYTWTIDHNFFTPDANIIQTTNSKTEEVSIQNIPSNSEPTIIEVIGNSNPTCNDQLTILPEEDDTTTDPPGPENPTTTETDSYKYLFSQAGEMVFNKFLPYNTDITSKYGVSNIEGSLIRASNNNNYNCNNNDLGSISSFSCEISLNLDQSNSKWSKEIIDQTLKNIKKRVTRYSENLNNKDTINNDLDLYSSYFIQNNGNDLKSNNTKQKIYYKDDKDLTINAFQINQNSKTIIVENHDIYIKGNINKSDKHSLAIIAINGNIYIDKYVNKIDALLLTDKEIRHFKSNQNDINYNGGQLVINGQIYGDFDHLFKHRNFHSHPENSGGAMVINFDLDFFTNPPPGLHGFTSHITKESIK